MPPHPRTWLAAACLAVLPGCIDLQHDAALDDGGSPPGADGGAVPDGSAPPDAGAPAPDAAPFHVLAFYNGTFDAAHIAFVNEANPWFAARAEEYNFTYESTNDWTRINEADLADYQVIMFLDDHPPNAQREAFEQYMRHGGAWFGFHVCAFNENPSSWDWYYNQFLGTGAFHSNTWWPTTAVLDVEDHAHPATSELPVSFRSAVSEWYSWDRDLRQNADIRILASVDPASFPLGTDPNQSWYSGYFPILWTNRNYRMLYANFGHDYMIYETNTPTSSTFDSDMQNRFIIDGLLWLGGARN